MVWRARLGVPERSVGRQSRRGKVAPGAGGRYPRALCGLEVL
jgi:hypothetical protein